MTTDINTQTQTAIRHDSSKTQWHLLPWTALEEVVKVLQFGAEKYSADNWRNGSGLNWSRTFNSTFRHLMAWWNGQDRDPETGLSHLAHCCCNVLFLLHYSLNKDRFNKDDRTKL